MSVSRRGKVEDYLIPQYVIRGIEQSGNSMKYYKAISYSVKKCAYYIDRGMPEVARAEYFALLQRLKAEFTV